MNMSPATKISISELVELCAIDSALFAKQFFPRTCRQEPALNDQRVWSLLDGSDRYVNIQMHRGSAKTSKLRMYTAKRIAYGIAHTILYIGKSEGHALRSVRWLRKQIEFNKQFSSVFNLRPGTKWQDSECEILHGVDNYPITIVAMGITGSIRGINFDDFRPDLIVIDDAIDEENAATRDQRTKIEDLILGSLKNSLNPASESPDAKMVILQTPQNKEDASTKALHDPEFKSLVCGCWTEETKDLPLHMQESSWPSRFPSTVLRKEKAAAIARNKLSLFLREMECKLTSKETSDFDSEWLQYYELEPPGGVTVISIDPVPPPSEIEISKGLKGKDFECFVAVTRFQGGYYVREIRSNRGHEPDWTIMTFFEMAFKWRPRTITVETVAYQKVLEWLLRKAMQVRRAYYVIKSFKDRNSKRNRILQGLQGIASNKQLYVHKSMTTFIQQFSSYPDVDHDDEIECVAVACMELQGLQYESGDEDELDGNSGDDWKSIMQDEKDIPALEYKNLAPMV